MSPSIQRPYLAACMMYSNHASYLTEWLEFHRLVGVERFFLYDNGSADDHLEVLGPYLEDGTVVLHDWPGVGVQIPMYSDCLPRHRDDARWIAFIDIDEFIFSPTGRRVSDVLVEYEGAPGVGVNLVNFGTSGHQRRPPGLVVESYLHVLQNPNTQRKIKSIVDPARAVGSSNPHYFDYRSGLAVDEQMRPITGPEFWSSEDVSRSRLRINHYVTKSEDEFMWKMSRRRADNGQFRGRPSETGEPPTAWKPWKPRHGDVLDEAIQTHVPALRAAVTSAEERLATRSSSRPGTGAAT